MLLALFVSLFLRLVLVAPDVEEFGDGGVGVRGDFNQIKANARGLFDSFLGVHDTEILAIFVDHPDFRGDDELIVARTGKLRRRLRTARIGRWYSVISNGWSNRAVKLSGA
jgi:hypothetical protein